MMYQLVLKSLPDKEISCEYLNGQFYYDGVYIPKTDIKLIVSTTSCGRADIQYRGGYL